MARSTRAIKQKQGDEARTGGWQGLTERAPSLVRPEQPTTGRVVALAALFPLTLGGAAILTHALGWRYLISPAWGVFMLVIGVAGVLYHAFNEKDLQYRRLYGALGALFVGLGVLFRLLPGSEGGLGGGTFLPYGAPSLLLGLGFLLSFVRNETDVGLRTLALNALLIVGAGCALLGFVLGVFSESFMVGQGVVLLALGLLYLAGYIGMQDPASERGYWV